MAEATHIKLTFRPNLELVSVVRRFVSMFFQRVLGDTEIVFQLALATHELLENAVKYATDAETTVTLEVAPDGRKVLLETHNRARPDDMDAVKERIDAMLRADDPDEYYLQEMRNSVQRRDGMSRLGLARINAEANMRLSVDTQGDLLIIRAEADIPGGGQ